jgi:hypothetical protein
MKVLANGYRVVGSGLNMREKRDRGTRENNGSDGKPQQLIAFPCIPLFPRVPRTLLLEPLPKE